MTDLTAGGLQPAIRRVEFDTADAKARLKRRHRSEARFRSYGIAALAVTTAFLLVLLSSIVSKGIPGFFQNVIVILERYRQPQNVSGCQHHQLGPLHPGKTRNTAKYQC